MLTFLVTYALGAFTFWPLILLFLYLCGYIFKVPTTADPDDGAYSKSEDQKYLQKQFGKFNQSASISVRPDLESDVEASCWVRKAPTFLGSIDNYDEAEVQMNKTKEHGSGSARNSLQNFMRQTKLIRTTKKSATDIPKTLYKCPKFWAVVRGGQLQLFEDQNERNLVHLIIIPHYLVTIWPLDLQEFELFFKRFPLVLISRTKPNGLVMLDLEPGKPPLDAEFLYVENPTEKEDLYFALIKESKSLDLDSEELDRLSLGPRDPVVMAKPIRVRKSEAQKLQSSIWSNELPGDTQWLNALIGRIFLAIKESKIADEYLRKKFNYKLKPISIASNIIGDIEIRSIKCGSAAPYISGVKLRELTPEGNLVVSAGINYSGGFRVILGTSVKLAAVTSLTSRQIPIELAATVKRLNGTLIFKIKPAPSDRIWYAFETMPDIDLQIEPVVYETQISLSMVTNFIKSKIFDSLKESSVMPFMDDLAFYDTVGSFYRGGIWESLSMTQEQTVDAAFANRPDSKVSHKRSGSSSSSLYLKDACSVDDIAETSSLSSRSTGTMRKIGNWVGRKHGSTDGSSVKSQVSSTVDLDSAETETTGLSVDISSGNLRSSSFSTPRSSATTHVTTTNASLENLAADKSDISDDNLSPSRSSSPSRRKSVKRKPVPISKPSALMNHKEASLDEVGKVVTPPVQTSLKKTSQIPDPQIAGVKTASVADAILDEIGVTPKPDFSALKRGSPSTGMFNELASGELSLGIEKKITRKNSFSSLHSLKSQDARSIVSNASSANSIAPSLPPRKRTVIHLSKVAPEHDL